MAASVDALLAAQTAGQLDQVDLGTEVRFYDEAGRMVVEVTAVEVTRTPLPRPGGLERFASAEKDLV